MILTKKTMRANLQWLVRALRAWWHDIPERVTVETTNVCNLRCWKCPTHEAARPRGEITLGTYAHIINAISNARSKPDVRFCGGGEDTLHPKLPSFVLQAVQSGARSVGITTNALALTRDLAIDLLDAGLTHVKFSLDVNDAKAYRARTGVDAYDVATANITEFCRLNRYGEYRCATTIKMNQYAPDAQEATEFKRRWAGVCGSVVVTGLHNRLGLRGAATAKRRTPCRLPWSQMQVLWTGQVALCCFDCIEGYYNMGNVAKETIGEYWRSSRRLRALRQAHRRLDFAPFPHCATCSTP